MADDELHSDTEHEQQRMRMRKLLKSACRRASRLPDYCPDALVQELARALVVLASKYGYAWPGLLLELIDTTAELNGDDVPAPLAPKDTN